MANEASLTKGADGFGKNPQNINKAGRPKKIYTILKELGYSKDDMRSGMGELAWYTIEDLRKEANDPDKPAIVQIVANQLVLAREKGDWSKVKDILEIVLNGTSNAQQNIQINFNESF